MSTQLKITTGQYSFKGRKEINQDFHGIVIPEEPQLSTKGIAIALADGISSSDVSQVASQAAVNSFLEDYYCTSDTWSVKTAAKRVLTATNSWMHAQTQRSQYRYDKDRGYVCTFSAMIIKSTTAHLFHVGDARVYKLHGNALEPLTNDHRVWVNCEQSYLGRALGVDSQLEIDYRTWQLEVGDIYILATDGVHEYIDAAVCTSALNAAAAVAGTPAIDTSQHLDMVAKAIAEEAYNRGSADNLTLQIIRIDALPTGDVRELYQQLSQLKLPPLLDARMAFDGYTIMRELHASSRSHIYLATDDETGETVVIKTPSIDLQNDTNYLERFLMEEWVARRINSAHVLQASPQNRKRNYLYVVTEFVEGQTLTQWMTDHPQPQLETVRDIVEQIAQGLRAFHRLEMLHQDLRPANIMIDSNGTVKIIDFGAVCVAGIEESKLPDTQSPILGTQQYTAPEYFIGDAGSPRADLFSLGVITYQMLTGRLPYGIKVSQIRTMSDLRKLRYEPVLDEERALPMWINDVLKKAVHPDPDKRYAELSEFIFDLRHPNTSYLRRTRQPLIERNPLLFWKGMSFALGLAVLVLAYCNVRGT